MSKAEIMINPIQQRSIMFLSIILDHMHDDKG